MHGPDDPLHRQQQRCRQVRVRRRVLRQYLRELHLRHGGEPGHTRLLLHLHHAPEHHRQLLQRGRLGHRRVLYHRHHRRHRRPAGDALCAGDHSIFCTSVGVARASPVCGLPSLCQCFGAGTGLSICGLPSLFTMPPLLLFPLPTLAQAPIVKYIATTAGAPSAFFPADLTAG